MENKMIQESHKQGVAAETITFLPNSGRFPRNGHGAGPGMPSFLNVEKGATAYLELNTVRFINNYIVRDTTCRWSGGHLERFDGV